MSVNVMVFIVLSLIVAADFGYSSFFLWSLSKNTDHPYRTFITGLAGFHLTFAFLNLFWPVVFIAGALIEFNDLLRHSLTAIILAVDVASIIGRRWWWKQMLLPALPGRESSEESST